MKKTSRTTLFTGLGLLALFALWTVLVSRVDVLPIGPDGSSVGFAALNGYVRDRIGVHMGLYRLTDWLGLAALCLVPCFGGLGLVQWIRRKSLLRVDRSILVLGVFYILVLAVYLFFEKAAINYRPVLIDGLLEVSYPSSTTTLSLCVLPTAMLQLRGRLRPGILRTLLLALLRALTVFLVTGRLISGVHWFSDIVGGVLLSAGLVSLYAAAYTRPDGGV